jgi:cytoskeletal protein RodZ
MRRSTPAIESPIPTSEDRASFGLFLVAARHRAGRSLEDIACTTKVRKGFLNALEEGRVEVMPEGIYRRAILRNYAAAVGLDPLVALERFDRTFGGQAPPEECDTAPPVAGSRSGSQTQQEARVRAMAESWRSARSIELPASCLAAAMAAFTLVFISQFVLHLDGVESTVSDGVVSTASPAATAEGGLSPGPPASAANDVDPSIGTGGHGPAERLPAPVSTQTALDAIEESAADGETRLTQESRLVITSNPAGARVTVDGIGWGFTPVTVRYLPPGTKAVRVTKDGYIGRERRVNVSGDGETVAVQLTLRPR